MSTSTVVAIRTAQQDAISGALLGARDPSARVGFLEEFNTIPTKSSRYNAWSNKSSGRIVNPNWVISGVNLSGQFNSSRGAQFDPSGRGFLVLGASSKSTNRILLKPRAYGAANKAMSKLSRMLWSTNDEVVFDTTIRTLAANTFANAIIQAGLVLTHVFDLTTDADQIKFWFAAGTDSANLYVATSIGGTDTLTDTGIDLAASTSYRLQIAIDKTRKATCYVNGQRVPCFTGTDGRVTDQTSALTASINLVPHIGMRAQTNSAARIKLGVFRIELSKNIAA